MGMELEPDIYVQGEFDSYEQEALEQFKLFSKTQPKMFKEWSETPSGTFYDVAAINFTGGCENVELKLRNDKKYNDCFIEMRKWDNLMHAWRTEGIAPLYINFLGDYKNVYVWFLPAVSKANVHLNVIIKKRNGRYKEEDRLGLLWSDAWHYQWNETTNTYDITEPTTAKKITKRASTHRK